jgi:hypothetical protein
VVTTCGSSAAKKTQKTERAQADNKRERAKKQAGNGKSRDWATGPLGETSGVGITLPHQAKAEVAPSLYASKCSTHKAIDGTFTADEGYHIDRNFDKHH